jgi:hypothetical protein
MLREVLPLPARDDAPVFIYVRDNVHGAAFVTGSSGVELVTQGALDDLLAATRGLGATAVSRLPSSVLSRTLRLGGPALRTKRALETAWRVFPQSLPLMRCREGEGCREGWQGARRHGLDPCRPVPSRHPPVAGQHGRSWEPAPLPHSTLRSLAPRHCHRCALQDSDP